MNAATVVVVGSLNIDLVVRAPRLPRPGETLFGSHFSTDEGGKGANQAVAAARMGAQVAMLGRVGADGHGQRLRAALHRQGIDCAALGVDEVQPTGVASIVVAADGENSIVVVPGANHTLTADHVIACGPLLAAARIVVLQLEVPLPAVAAALRCARAARVTTVLNAAPAAALGDDLLALVDWLIVNEGEAQVLLGESAGEGLDGVAAAQVAAEKLRARLVQPGQGQGPEQGQGQGQGHPPGASKQVVVTLGAAGLVHADADGVTHHAAASARAVDATGAGDTFVGALAAGLALGASPADALRDAQAAAAIAVTRHGSQSAMPTRDEVAASRSGETRSAA